jgi:uncharacterized protein (DUF427 family)
MPKASWNGEVIAEATEDKVQIVEGNVYFPPESVRHEYLQQSDKATTCPWKGVASYYHIVVGDAVNQDAAWTYATPKEAAKQIAGHIAFWRGVDVER